MPEYRDELFEWDEDKSAERLARSGFDFHAVARIIESGRFVERRDDVHSSDEDRFVATGLLGAVFVSAIYTERAGRIRIISAFEARDLDIAEYVVKYASEE